MNDDVIIPYCIWHYIDIETQTFLGYIGGPKKIMKNGVITFDCAPDEKNYSKWFLADSFYAVSPSFRPIPVGMKIFCAKKNIRFPYNTNDLYLMYDPYNIKDDCIYFTTYIKPVPNTKPLYFHKIQDNIFPSFDSKPPSSSSEWTQTFISPIYVMTNKDIKFKCVNSTCLPWIDEIPDLYDFDPHEELLSLQNCVVYCNELVVSKNNGRPSNILQIASDQNSKHLGSISKSNKKKSSCICMFIIVITSLVFFLIIIYYFLKNCKE
jgi:hypothetical protein